MAMLHLVLKVLKLIYEYVCRKSEYNFLLKQLEKICIGSTTGIAGGFQDVLLKEEREGDI